MKLSVIKFFLAGAAAVMAVVSCSDNGSGEDSVPEQYADFERVPLSSKIENVQPMTGIVLWTTKTHPILKQELQF